MADEIMKIIVNLENKCAHKKNLFLILSRLKLPINYESICTWLDQSIAMNPYTIILRFIHFFAQNNLKSAISHNIISHLFPKYEKKVKWI